MKLSTKLLMTTGLALLPGIAWAGSDTAAGPAVTAIEEVIVTAQKREEKLQDVPIAMNALGRADLEKIDFSDLRDLTAKIPALNLAPYPQGSSMLIMYIRGIGLLDAQQITLDPGVGIYLDDSYIARGQGITMDMADIERVEVLRGPQGTLYGRNTTGGAVKFVTAKPTGEFGVKETFDAGSFGQWRTVTNVNLPEFYGFSTKFSYIRSEYDGWVKNSGTAGNYGRKDREGYRAAVRWRPSDSVTVDYAYDHGKQDGTSDFLQHSYTIVPFGPNNFPVFTTRQRQTWRPVNLPIRDNFVNEGQSLTIIWEIDPNTTLKSASAYREVKVDQLLDTVEAFDSPAASSALTSQHEFVQDLQLNGAMPDLRIKYVLGAFYFNEGGRSLDASSGFAPFFVVPYVGPTLADFPAPTSSRAENTSAAVFANITWAPPILDERMDIILGGRYSWDSRDTSRSQVAPASTLTGHTTYTNFDPSVTLDYKWTDKIHTYAKYATAYRSGGFSLRNSNLRPFKPENLTTFEAGLKSTWWSNRLLANVAVFTQKYKDIQINLTDPISIPQEFVTVNAGRQRTNGVEGDFQFVPAEGLTLSANVAFLDAGQLTALNPFIGPPPGTSYTSLPIFSPRWAYTVGIEYAFPRLPFGVITTSLNYNYSGKQVGADGVFPPDDFRPSYGLLNARITLSDIKIGKRAIASIAAWGKNLTDEEAQVGFRAFEATHFGEPRSFGVSLTFNY